MLDFSIVVFFIVIGLDLQRYNFFLISKFFLQFFFIFFCNGLRLTLRRLRDYKTTRLQVAAALLSAVSYWQAPYDSLSRRSFRTSVNP